MRSALEDKQSPSLILWHLPVKYDLNQSSAFPVTPNQSSSLLKKIVLSMVSKAASVTQLRFCITLLVSGRFNTHECDSEGKEERMTEILLMKNELNVFAKVTIQA